MYICPLYAQVYRTWQMRFIFSLVANLTYTLFCVSIQFIILFFYRLLFFPNTYLLSSSLTVFLVYISMFFYALCIFLLVVFDANSFKSHNDVAVENERKTAKPADDDSDTGSDKDVPAKTTGDYVKTLVAGPEDVQHAVCRLVLPRDHFPLCPGAVLCVFVRMRA